jgi:hypothetical protein
VNVQKPKGKPRGGSRKGKPNKSTKEIREIISSCVDFPRLVKSLEKRAIESSDQAAKILFEYGYGKPKEVIEVDAGTNTTEIVKIFAEMVSNSGAGSAT